MRGKAVVIVLVLSLSLMFSMNVNQDTILVESIGIKLDSTRVATPSDYTPLGRINVENDTALLAIASSGSGGIMDPLIIEGWNITVDAGFAIIIRDTTMYFRIQNCWIDTGDMGLGVGIWVYDVPVGTANIREVHIQDCYQGIQFQLAPGTTVSTCSFKTCEIGIQPSSSDNAVIYNNTVSDCSRRGIDISNCDGVNIVQNKIERINQNGFAGSNTHQGTAIIITSCTSAIIYNNTCTDGWYHGISVDGTLSSIEENEVSNFRMAGIELETGDGIICANNSVYDNDGWGIYSLTAFATIGNNTVSSNGIGIGAYNLNNLVIENNTLTNDGFYFPYGIIVDYAGVQEGNNLVNGFPLGYLVSEVSTTYSTSFGQVVLIGCDGVVLENQHCSNTYDGVFMRYSDNCRISNSQFLNNRRNGIWIEDCTNTEIEHTIVSFNGQHGCEIRNCSPLTITNVTSSYNIENGFDILDSYTLTISLSHIVGNQWGITSNAAGSATISSNTFADSLTGGLGWQYNWDAQVVSNDFSNDGIVPFCSTIAEYVAFANNQSGNVVNGRPFGIYISLEETIISTEHGQVFLVNCTEVTLTDLDCSNTLLGIGIFFSTDCNISDSVSSNNKRPSIQIHDSSGTLIQGISSDNSLQEGILVFDSPYTSIIDSFCRGNYDGIRMDSSNYATIEGTILTNNSHRGIFIEDGNLATISENICNFNGHQGIAISRCDESIIDSNECGNNSHGIYISDSMNNYITRNLIYNSSHDGIYTEYSDNLVINWNTVSRSKFSGISIETCPFSAIAFNILVENGYFGVMSTLSDNLLVHHCLFIENNMGGVQGLDSMSVDSQWYDATSAEGNYWSDWDGTGPYEIVGGLLDIYPLGNSDADEDGISDEWEILNGLDPYSSDSDGDSIPDLYEVENGLDPLSDDSGLDEDGDGLTNLEEYNFGTSANNSDSDGDLMPDLWEIENYLYPLFDDASFDPDGDGSTNLQEYLAGTNPHFNEGLAGITTTTTTTTTNTTTTQPSTDIILIILAAVGGFGPAVIIIYLYQRKTAVKGKSKKKKK